MHQILPCLNCGCAPLCERERQTTASAVGIPLGTWHPDEGVRSVLMAQSLVVSLLKTAQKGRAGAFLEERTRPADDLMKRFNSQHAVRCMTIGVSGTQQGGSAPPGPCLSPEPRAGPRKAAMLGVWSGETGCGAYWSKELSAVGDNLHLASLRRPFDKDLVFEW